MNEEIYNIRMVSVESIRVVNPRKRDRVKYAEIVNSINNVGLKTPIVVAPRIQKNDNMKFDLVCGEGRLNAFIKAGESEIPARIVEASREKVLLMGLAENIARRQPDKVSMIREINRLSKDGYTNAQIAKKFGFSDSYISQIKSIMDKGNRKLVEAVIRGKINLKTAIGIVECSDNFEIQNMLNDAYSENKIKAIELRVIRNILNEKKSSRRLSGNLTKEIILNEFQKTTKRSRAFLAKVEVCDTTIAFIKGAFKKMLNNEGFIILLKSEGIGDIPKYLKGDAL